MGIRITSKTLACAAAATIASTILGAYVWHEEHRPPMLEVYVIPLSRGQAIFIRTPNDERILVGGGPNGEVIRHISSLIPFYSRRIDFLIAQSEESSDLTGLIDVTNRYDIGRAYVQNLTLQSLGLSGSTDPVFKEFLSALKKNDIALERIVAGDSFHSRNVDFQFIFPSSPEEFAYSKASAPSVGLKITYGSSSFVFTGKSTRKIQKYIAGTIGTSSQTVLITETNGSSESLSAELFDALSPLYFTYARNISYSVATKKVKDLIPEQGINVREYAYVKFVSDGSNVQVEYR
jgi:beta-lactamase superfamily II metal-dependent hydrolase